MSTPDPDFRLADKHMHPSEILRRLEDACIWLGVPYTNLPGIDIFRFRELELRIKDYCPPELHIDQWREIAQGAYYSPPPPLGYHPANPPPPPTNHPPPPPPPPANHPPPPPPPPSDYGHNHDFESTSNTFGISPEASPTTTQRPTSTKASNTDEDMSEPNRPKISRLQQLRLNEKAAADAKAAKDKAVADAKAAKDKAAADAKAAKDKAAADAKAAKDKAAADAKAAEKKAAAEAKAAEAMAAEAKASEHEQLSEETPMVTWVSTDAYLPSLDPNLDLICRSILRDQGTYIPLRHEDQDAKVRSYQQAFMEMNSTRDSPAEFHSRVLVLYSEKARSLEVPDYTSAHPSRRGQRYWKITDDLIPTGDPNANIILEALLKSWKIKYEYADFRNDIDKLTAMTDSLRNTQGKSSFEVWFEVFLLEWNDICKDRQIANWMLCHPSIWLADGGEIYEGEVIWEAGEDEPLFDIEQMIKKAKPRFQFPVNIDYVLNEEFDPVKDSSTFTNVPLPEAKANEINKYWAQRIDLARWQLTWECKRRDIYKPRGLKIVDIPYFTGWQEIESALANPEMLARIQQRGKDEEAKVREDLARSRTLTAAFDKSGDKRAASSPILQPDSAKKMRIVNAPLSSTTVPAIPTPQQTAPTDSSVPLAPSAAPTTIWHRKYAFGLPLHAAGEPLNLTRDEVIRHRVLPLSTPPLNFSIRGEVTPYNMPRSLRALEDCMIIPVRNLALDKYIPLTTLSAMYPYDFTDTGVLRHDRVPRGRPAVMEGEYVCIFGSYLLVGSNNPKYLPSDKNKTPWIDPKKPKMTHWKNDHDVGDDVEMSGIKVNWDCVEFPLDIDVSAIDFAWLEQLKVYQRSQNSAVAAAADAMDKAIDSLNWDHPFTSGVVSKGWRDMLKEVQDPRLDFPLSAKQKISIQEVKVAKIQYPSYPWLDERLLLKWHEGFQSGEYNPHPGASQLPNANHSSDPEIYRNIRKDEQPFKKLKAKPHPIPPAATTTFVSSAPPAAAPSVQNNPSSQIIQPETAVTSAGAKATMNLHSSVETLQEDSDMQDSFTPGSFPDIGSPFPMLEREELEQGDNMLAMKTRTQELMKSAAEFTSGFTNNADDEWFAPLYKLCSDLQLRLADEVLQMPLGLRLAKYEYLGVLVELQHILLDWAGDPEGPNGNGIDAEYQECFKTLRFLANKKASEEEDARQAAQRAERDAVAKLAAAGASPVKSRFSRRTSTVASLHSRLSSFASGAGGSHKSVSSTPTKQ